jgi:hypothetical protein
LWHLAKKRERRVEGWNKARVSVRVGVNIWVRIAIVFFTCPDRSWEPIEVDAPSAWSNTEKMVYYYRTTCNDWQ